MKAVVGYIKKLGLGLWCQLKKSWRYVMVTLLFSVIALAVVLSFFSLKRDPQLATATVALGTLVLALVTALHIVNTNQQEKRRREENRRIREEEKEYEFKRRCMADIHDWAQEGVALLTELYPSFDLSTQRRNLIRLAPLRAVNNWMMNASRTFNEKELPRRVDEAAQNLKEYVEMLERPVLGGADLHERCRKSFVKLLEHVANLKVKLQL